MEIYERLAEVYDSGGWMEYSRRLFPYLQDILRRFRFRPKRILDLACGTGTLAIAMALEGYQVVGVDRSAAMLREAEKKAQQTGVEVTFLRQDMRWLALKEPVDLVTCFFDSLNYLLSYRDLVHTLRRVSRVLNAEGLFVFDINTPAGLASHWNYRKEAQDMEDVAIIGSNSYDPQSRLGTIRITVFKKVGQLFERFTEVHTERAYTRREVKNALREGGLKLLSSYDCMTFSRPGRKTGRILYMVTKLTKASF
jgi:ubiquinone/menaquinone biosynthesis C-methylase UbiE